MIRVRTASRLHFGLFTLPPSPYPLPPPGGRGWGEGGGGVEHWPNLHGEAVLPARQFGGVGLMVDAPGVQVAVTPAAAWSAEGPLAERALTFARCFAATLPADALPPQRLIIEHCAPAHSGLGTGTQLALAVARALAAAAGQPNLGAVELARRVGRGLRSALGIHGFAQGGFLVEAGKRREQEIAPLVARADFPESWRMLLVLPEGGAGRHGIEEQQAFALLADRSRALAQTEALCRLVLLGMLPALAEGDLSAFGEALYDFNARVGEMFAPVQGGTYAGPLVSDLVAHLRRWGVRGVGQSSWGPTVFALAADAAQAEALASRVGSPFGTAVRTVIARPANRGQMTG